MLYSINNYNAKDNTKSNWSTAYFHCGPVILLGNYLDDLVPTYLPSHCKDSHIKNGSKSNTNS